MSLLKIPFYKGANEITNNQFNQLKALKNKLRWLEDKWSVLLRSRK